MERSQSNSQTYAVIATKWKGDGSLGASKHTTPKQALQNQAKRDQILDNPKVKSLYHNFTIEDGSKVTIDHNIASAHIRHVLNDIKRSRNNEVYSPQSGHSSTSEDTEDMESDDGDSDSESEPIKKAKLSEPERIPKKSRRDKGISEGVKYSMDLIKKLKAKKKLKSNY